MTNTKKESIKVGDKVYWRFRKYGKYLMGKGIVTRILANDRAEIKMQALGMDGIPKVKEISKLKKYKDQ